MIRLRHNAERIAASLVSFGMLKGSFCLLFILFFLGSCSVERRLYRPGLSVQWFSSLKGQGREVIKKDFDTLSFAINSEEQWLDKSQGSPQKTLEDQELSSIQNDLSLLVEETRFIKSDISSLSPIALEDTTIVDQEDTQTSLSEESKPYKKERSNAWIYYVLLILVYIILAAVLYVGALYPFQTGIVLMLPLSFLFGLDDRAGFLFGIFSGLSYIGLFFLTPMIGFWGIFFLGLLVLLLSLLLATVLDDRLDQGERMDDYPPPPPQADPGEDW